MDLKQLEAFAAVVEKGSFSEAARVLYLTQPTVSAHVDALEKELSTVLVLRTTKEVSPSAEGSVLYKYARELLSLRDEAEAAVRSSVKSKRVVIAACEPAADYLLPELIARFSGRQGCEFEIKQGNTRDCEKSLLKGESQLAVLGARSASDKLRCYPAAPDGYVLITPAGKGTEELTREYLRHTGFLMREEGSATRTEAERLLKRFGMEVRERCVRVPVRSNRELALRVAAGEGAALVSRTFAERSDISGYEISPCAVSNRRQLSVASHRKYEISEGAKAFLRFLKKNYQSQEV